jgi:hypothetical protein
MSRKRVAFLFIAYFVVAWVGAGFLLPASEWRYGLVGGVIPGALGYGWVIYMASGALPFAVWGARKFKAANARSLFIPWAILLLLVMALWLPTPGSK